MKSKKKEAASDPSADPSAEPSAEPSVASVEPSAAEAVTPSSPPPPPTDDMKASSPETAPGGEIPSSVPSGSADKELIELRAEKDEFYDQLIRLKAEYENFRKRIDREKPELIRHGRDSLLDRLFPLYDVLLAAHDQIAAHGEEQSTKDLAKGLKMIFREFTEVFKAEGVEIIQTVGKPYDFNQHEVLGQVETAEHPEGTVVEELQRGYRIGERILRHAKVRVAKKK